MDTLHQLMNFISRSPSPYHAVGSAAALLEEGGPPVDVLLLCGGSAGDLPRQSPRYAGRFHIVDSFDTHARAPDHFAAVDAAAQAGVRIVSIDSGVDSSQVSTYIGTDNYAAGQMAAQAALEQVEGPLSVGLVNYDEGTANGQERERGVLDALTRCGRASVAAEITTLVDAGQAREDTAALLAGHPDINVLVAFNEPTSVGAAQV